MSYNIQRTTFKVSDFVTWYKTNTLKLNPDFQRRSVWNSKAKSYLIDTILRGLPIPVIILRDQKTNLDNYLPRKEVVDGQQRLNTVISFILKDFKKKEDSFIISKTHNESYGGSSFVDLPEEAKQDILDYEFFVHVLPSTVTTREILEIFSRMNSTGVNLNAQELRNASYFGEFKTFAFNLANSFYDYWIKWKVFTDFKIARMDEVELINDFLIVAIDGIKRRTPQIVNNYYKEYDDEGSIPNLAIIRARINNIILFINSVFGKDISHSPFRKTPLLYALYTTIYMNEFDGNTKNVKIRANKRDFSENLKILSKKMTKAREEWKEDKEVKVISQKTFEAFSRATNIKENRTDVVEFLSKSLY